MWKYVKLLSQCSEMSYTVKLVPTAMGPLIQFMLSPLYRPRQPSDPHTRITVREMEVYLLPWPVTPIDKQKQKLDYNKKICPGPSIH